MPNKKGDFSPVFKYIFALIAGVLFLSFFVGFAMKLKEQQGTIETGRIVFGFDDLLTLFSASSDSSIVYPEQGFPSTVELTILGDKIKSGKITKPTTKIVFSQEVLKGKQFFIWTKRWQMPFTVDSFFYLADGRVPIYVVYDADSEEIAKELTDKYSGFPKNFKVDKLHVDQMSQKDIAALRAKLKDYAKIRFIILSNKKPLLERFTAAETRTIKPTEINGETSWEYGTAEFKDGKSTYLGKEMLTGAITAENKESYDWAKDKAMKKLSLMARLYEKKAELLERICPGQYTAIAAALKGLATAEPLEGALDSYAQRIDSLKESNHEFKSGCPEVF